MNRSIITVIGTTGVGKSDLGVQLSKALQGEVVNADSMQVYKGLDIITNKITTAEREGITHHLMDFLELPREYKVTEFINDATRIICEIHDRNHIPIVVGGTNYYIQSLLWNNSLVGDLSVDNVPEESESDDDFGELLNANTDVLYERLQNVDPIMANRWHRKDRRKIRRSLQIYLQTGKRHSDWIEEQQHQGESGNSLRYPRTCIFWLYAEPKVLDARLDARVDKMIESGLFDEIMQLREKSNSTDDVIVPDGTSVNYTRGIWQAIGYKEFDPYMTALSLDPPIHSDKLEVLKSKCIDAMKTATRRKLVLVLKLILALDEWDRNVRDTAIDIAREFLATGRGPDPFSFPRAQELLTPTKNTTPYDLIRTWSKHDCEVCSSIEGRPVTLDGQNEADQHFRSKMHRSNVKLKKQIDDYRDGDMPEWLKKKIRKNQERVHATRNIDVNS
ncbi:10162_t:CDS:10 [Paraglomus occultum]|uniref:tRNA dimethylallyltransferase n=1 Tax=Paraglomus occultum TaxID=144539 RepID=A0A9N8ZZJ7_9GLOM|nr:10162_t:CDS:10 [Paraglomus occultum]